MEFIVRVLLLLMLLLGSPGAWADAQPAYAADKAIDPLRSPLWGAMHQRFLGGTPVVFDPAVEVRMPTSAEDPLGVPVEVHLGGLKDVERIVVFADLNPLPLILEYWPQRASGGLAFRLKVEQSTPVRAAARTRDGLWHVGGAWVASAGGGCTMPSHASADPIWQERLGEVSARQWSRADGSRRLRMRVIHPMDTGLAAGIPVFHIDELQVNDAQGGALARLKLFEPVSENPMLSLDLAGQGPLRIEGRDTQGNRISAGVAP